MANKGYFASAALFILALVVGYYGGSKSWNGVVYLSDGSRWQNGRTPAAIKRELDFSRLDGAELITATQKRLVSAARTILRDGLVGVELGHFVTKDSNGQRRLACDAAYDRIQLRFEADGIASSGVKPIMEIDGPCRSSMEDISRIEPIWIPVEKILDIRPANMDLDFFQDVKFKFDNMGETWPLSWNLQYVRLYNSQEPNREVSITAGQIREIRESPFVIYWVELEREPNSTRAHY